MCVCVCVLLVSIYRLITIRTNICNRSATFHNPTGGESHIGERVLSMTAVVNICTKSDEISCVLVGGLL